MFGKKHSWNHLLLQCDFSVVLDLVYFYRVIDIRRSEYKAWSNMSLYLLREHLHFVKTRRLSGSLYTIC